MTTYLAEVNELTLRDLERELNAAGASAKTVEAYRQGLLSLEKYLRGHDASHGRTGYPECCKETKARDLLKVTKAEIGDWLIALRGTHAKDSICSYFSSVRRFYSYAAAEELIGRSPMANMKKPPASDKPIPIPAVDDIRALLETCKGKDFDGLRDTAIIRLFCETGGPRCSEVALLPLEHVDMRSDFVRINGKGGKWRGIPMSARTAKAMSRYLRARADHPKAEDSEMAFLGLKGSMTRSGVYQMIQRRCEQAGVAAIHPHMFRHFETHQAKRAGMSDSDLMRLNGWSTRAMLDRYGAAAADERAAMASRRLALGNQL
ncbi:MAG TPA: tyrosine-type recombinase/integrase [Streptosporangiaceae bacterium]|jgi:site-specific recombinase XerD|nr:tyrosine-type recombinase/integrase [Streptosporangiaceae bacterium]